MKLNYRVVIFIVAAIFGIALSMPSLLQTEKGSKITLGLDLQGGLHMLLGVDTDEAIRSKIKSLASAIKYAAEDEDLIIDGFKVKNGNVEFELLDRDDMPKMDAILEKIEGIAVQKVGMRYSVSLTPAEKESIKKYAITQAVDTIRNRLDQFGLAEPTVAKQGKEKILVEVPGIKTPEQEQRIRELIAKAAHLQLMAIDEERAANVDNMTPAEAAKYGDVISTRRVPRSSAISPVRTSARGSRSYSTTKSTAHRSSGSA